MVEYAGLVMWLGLVGMSMAGAAPVAGRRR